MPGAADEATQLIAVFSDIENLHGMPPWSRSEYAERLLELVPAEQLPESVRELALGFARVPTKG